MITKRADFTQGPNQVSTTDVAAGEVAADLSTPLTSPDSPLASTLYPPEGPAPEGTNPATAQQMAREAAVRGESAPGVEAEEVVWEARYSLKNFIGRLTLWTLASLGWLGLLGWMWSTDRYHGGTAFSVNVLGIILGIAWMVLLFRMFRARQCHFYQLTTRRLFVSSGLFSRRRDQMELIGIKDVFERQTLVERWLSVGTVVVVSPKSELPTFYLAGVNDPKRVLMAWCPRLLSFRRGARRKSVFERILDRCSPEGHFKNLPESAIHPPGPVSLAPRETCASWIGMGCSAGNLGSSDQSQLPPNENSPGVAGLAKMGRCPMARGSRKSTRYGSFTRSG
jgi:hypothetical protein